MIMKRGQDNTSYAIKGLQYLILNRQLLKKKKKRKRFHHFRNWYYSHCLATTVVYDTAVDKVVSHENLSRGPENE